MVKINLDAIKKLKEQIIKEKLEEIGQLVVEKAKLMLDGDLKTKNSPILKGIKYRVKGHSVYLYVDNKILVYLEKGTKPHDIKAKNGKSLKFRFGEDGPKGSYGKEVFVKKVHHPGFEAKPFIHKAIYFNKAKIKQILRK